MEKFLTVNEVCTAAGVKPSTFRRYRQQNPDMFPPAEKKGNQPLFSIETVEDVKAYRDEMIRRRAHAKTAAPDIEISGAQYRTILLHVEKISNGQNDFANVLKKELRDLLSVEAENLIEEILTQPDAAINRAKNFLAKFPLVVVEDNGARYRLVELFGTAELELIAGNIKDSDSGAQEPREDVPNVETGQDTTNAKIDSEGDKKCSADFFFQRAETLGDSSGSVGEPYTEDETPQDFQSTLDTLDTAADNVTSFEMADVESISAAVNSDNDSSVEETAADAPSNIPDNCPQCSTAVQAAPMGDGHDTQNENQPVETAAPVVFEDKPAYAPIVETPPFIEDMAVPLEEKTLQELAVEGRLCFERGDEHLKQGAKYYIEGGRRLVEAKRRLKHGQWLPWLKENFSFNEDSAINRMNLAKRFGGANSETFRNFKPSALIKMLALPKGYEERFIETQADAGRPVESQTIKELTTNIKTFKQKQSRSKDDSGEVGSGKYFGVWKDNQGTVDELKHADSGRYEPSEDVPDVGHDILPDGAKIVSKASTNPGEDFQLTPPPIDETKNLPPIALNKNSTVEWYTPAEIVEAAREVLGAIDLDPASSETANQTVKAEKFYTAADNGLDKPWSGRVWLNPPFASGVIELFVEKIISEFVFGNVTSAVMISDNATETRWFRRLVNAGAAIVFTTGRINFYKGGTFEAGSPTRGQCLFYFGDDADKFYRVFAPFGWGCRVVKLPAEKEKELFDVGEAVETC